MKMTNKLYDVLKYIALVVLPGIATLYAMLAGIWGLPFAEEIPETILAAEAFLGAVLCISSEKYKQSK